MGEVRVLLSTSEDDPGIGEVDYAVIPLTELYIRQLLAHMTEIENRKDVNYFSSFDYTPYWMSSDERKLYKAIIEGTAEDASSMELEMCEVCDRWVQWTAVYKHSNVKVETDLILKETLEQLLEVAEGKKTLDQIDLSDAEKNTLQFTIIAELKEQFGAK